jgi:oligoribonuclease NrnB/cAMP/cGMP phosphodiesterase (DHH superfamily)
MTMTTKLTKPTVVIYHADCADGFCGAWVCRKYLLGNGVLEKDIVFHPAHYGDPAPDVSSCYDVYLVDFCYPLEEMKQIIRDAGSVTVMDHHKTLNEDVGEFLRSQPEGRVTYKYDVTKSGAEVAWLHLFPDSGYPLLVTYVADRDLWRFALSQSRAVNAYISALPYDFSMWDAVASLGYAGFAQLCAMGEAILMKTRSLVSLMKKHAIIISFEGYTVPVVNCHPVDLSDVLEALYQEYPFSLSWWQRGDGLFNYSLRSNNVVDVSEIARKYGGGGHKNAAGFESTVLVHVRSPV